MGTVTVDIIVWKNFEKAAMRRQMRRKTEKVSGSEKMDFFFGRDLRMKEWIYGSNFFSIWCPKLIELSNKANPSSIRRFGGPLQAAKLKKMPKKSKNGPKVVIIGPLSGRNAGTEVGLKRDSMADTQAGREAGRCGPLRAVEPQNVLKS